jgi:hypothetical protein
MARYDNARMLQEKLLETLLKEEGNIEVELPDRLLPHNKIVTIPRFADLFRLEISSTGMWGSGEPGYNNVIIELILNREDPALAALNEMLCGLSLFEKNRWPFTSYEVCILHMNPHVSGDEKYYISLYYPDTDDSRPIKSEEYTVSKLSHKKLIAKILQAMKFYHKLYRNLKKDAQKMILGLPKGSRRVPARFAPGL